MPEIIKHSFTSAWTFTLYKHTAPKTVAEKACNPLRLYKYKGGCAFMGAVIILFKSKIIKSAYKHMRLYAGY